MYTICGEGAGGGRGKNGYPVICTHDFLKLSDDHFSLTSNVVSGSELLIPLHDTYKSDLKYRYKMGKERVFSYPSV